MLIVEGSDLLGKTAFIKALLVEAERQCFPMIPQHFGLLPQGWNYRDDYIPYINRQTVMDRFILSELVYGETLRNGCKITPVQFDMLQALLWVDFSITVVVVGAPQFYEHHIRTHPRIHDEEFGVDALLDVNRAFIEVINDERWHGYEYTIDEIVTVEGNVVGEHQGYEAPSPALCPAKKADCWWARGERFSRIDTRLPSESCAPRKKKSEDFQRRLQWRVVPCPRPWQRSHGFSLQVRLRWRLLQRPSYSF